MPRNIDSLVCLFAFSCLCVSGCYVVTDPPPAQSAPPPAAEPVMVEAPPPPPPAPPPEAAPPPPSPDHYWVVGYHRWNGHGYRWERGHYERRPHARARYVPAHWEARGNAHVWMEAHWE